MGSTRKKNTTAQPGTVSREERSEKRKKKPAPSPSPSSSPYSAKPSESSDSFSKFSNTSKKTVNVATNSSDEDTIMKHVIQSQIELQRHVFRIQEQFAKQIELTNKHAQLLHAEMRSMKEITFEVLNRILEGVVSMLNELSAIAREVSASIHELDKRIPRVPEEYRTLSEGC
jgi:hypothetical protein